mgnify:CR=1 FL=1
MTSGRESGDGNLVGFIAGYIRQLVQEDTCQGNIGSGPPIIAEAVCRDQHHLLQFLTERLNQDEGIRESESFIHLKIVKEVYF